MCRLIKARQAHVLMSSFIRQQLPSLERGVTGGGGGGEGGRERGETAYLRLLLGDLSHTLKRSSVDGRKERGREEGREGK